MSLVYLLNFTEILESRNRETETTDNNIFRNCREHFFPTTFVDVAVLYANKYSKHKLEFPWQEKVLQINN